MKKTTVYLSDEEAASLQRAASATGLSQSELIREGIRLVCKPERHDTHGPSSPGADARRKRAKEIAP
jgi:Arc/MetJ-type ribon-helix-helix transcriptional regulator